MSYHWREYAKKFTTPHQRHQLIMLREHLYGPYARATARWRVLPDFIIIGAPRSGTTHLFNTLRHHPQIVPSRIKEVKFFYDDKKFFQGTSLYRSYFPLKFFIPSGGVAGEASPNYLSSNRSAERIASLLPDAKLIVILRDPVERFLSGYFYKQQKANHNGIEWPTLEDLVLNDGYKNNERFKIQHYAPFLKQYDSYFQDGRLLVLKSEDYFSEPTNVLKEVCKYLNVDTNFDFPTLSSRNRAIQRESVSAEVREKLYTIFKPENELLYTYLNKNLDW